MVDEENIEETDANARLIAAAPDLMAACEAIVQVPNMKMSPQVKVVARQCLAALNKAVAEGEGDDMSEAKHSPLPWRFDATGRYVYDADNVIAKCDGPSTYDGGLPAEEIEANGEFIVLACNSHDDLLDVVHRLVAYINQGCIATYDEWHEMFRDAKAAIAKVEEA